MNADAVKMLQGRYCNSLTSYSRFVTREVAIGDVPMGGNNPIRIQSMTTTDTMDTIGTVEQTIRMVNAGCEYVRITAPSIKEANNLAEIKKQLRMRGYNVPLVADIHFTPNAAEVAARIVEKVRVNPGNYADKKKFDTIEYTDLEYQGELDRIFQKFTPLVNICKEYGTAMRIGTNHGSLSDRIMSRYGDTPQGMVESAMEFIRMCEALGYYSLVVSMKSSNPQVMVQAYRLLVQTMVAEGMNYPLHLGVTEAGDGEDGRIKSAVGIGTLLEDGLGDTVRVSLTEEPEAEAPVAIALVKRYSLRSEILGAKSEVAVAKNKEENISHPAPQSSHSPYEYKKRDTYEANAFIGGHMVPRVVIDLSRANLKDAAVMNDAGYLYSALLDKYTMAEQSVDFVYLGDSLPSFTLPGNLKQLYNYTTWQKLTNKTLCHPLFTLDEYSRTGADRTSALNLVRIKNADLDTDAFGLIPLDKSLVFVLETDEAHGMADQRTFFLKLQEMELDVPVIVKRSYTFSDHVPSTMDHGQTDLTTYLQLYAATDLGALLVDGFGDGIWIDAPQVPANIITSTAFGILQATRSRISKTEYISCPSCGRTLFDLMLTTQMIRSRTSHLKGLKIGIMGCIVNGPGEMADADYGYVGSGTDKVTLYRGQEAVKKNINSANALDELIGIIKSDGNWLEPAE
ncbi:(E)-4-hydroxy-3-methylbut-2-enyl-diphosphate synthase [Mucilaginibacter phyllosphaerae]|uniref:4-hydroxy-3-methylbut-2-en-1-yl diphosphate synthase (flavodoxin) n=1 Tax=Mucilaginibacter phyllosphaerae TaxID=1812349 RepID=A0A4Y8AGP4_9SPHI|nr:(E)-4-hydroxy-3-methylbut-2-enyl-diphosphate synthase [Mucilaginibacter phyllosphaerae]MBB3968869.1 (E)-4-hydroxy-3-methylbut-2-enyl-diphosphate synthase [Mucilaginibacter phyllosphaerae]TEW67502.1 (E)-4-hydroxy-3-methylbut-2-enyl-diphosphate synthase [Mucilaginibacter phyllosphaerae]GGH13424.1 4-hydroxy-3-methylbut-2-en-1-yl diphosphate synthase (flavodoxin) [Mucilaginibacter phyllosphaerae]